MENNKLTQDFLKQLRRIADALEKGNLLTETQNKKVEKFNKIQEKKAALEFKEIQEKRKVGQVVEILSSELDKS
tara:strand:+ start:7491 stop:7712 length:222 start_codon:yes stop_codon:yes gene_type:complete